MASDDEDAYLYGSEDEAPAPKKQKLEKPEEPQHELLDESEELSDDDVEFVIGDSAPKILTAAPAETANAAPAQTQDQKAGSVAPKADTAKVDVNAVAELDGKKLTLVDLEELKDKPWRIPGADISDYFNYGFDEFTWTAYCHKQDKTRGEFNPQKVMAQMMGGGKKGMMPFPMPPFGKNMPPGPSGMSGYKRDRRN